MHFKIPSLLYPQWTTCVVCIIICALFGTHVGRTLKHSKHYFWCDHGGHAMAPLIKRTMLALDLFVFVFIFS